MTNNFVHFAISLKSYTFFYLLWKRMDTVFLWSFPGDTPGIRVPPDHDRGTSLWPLATSRTGYASFGQAVKLSCLNIILMQSLLASDVKTYCFGFLVLMFHKWANQPKRFIKFLTAKINFDVFCHSMVLLCLMLITFNCLCRTNSRF